MEFTTWSILGTYAGALAMIMIVTQLTKNISFIQKLPTQIWSYLIALAILYPAQYFTAGLTLENAVLTLFNGAILALGANGGYEAVNRVFGKKQ